MIFNRTFFSLSAGILLVSTVMADVPGFERPLVNRLGHVGVGSSFSAHTLGIGRVALGVYGNGTSDQSYLDSLRIKRINGSAFLPSDAKISSYNINPYLAAGLTDFFDISAVLHVAAGRFSPQPFSGPPFSRQAALTRGSFPGTPIIS
ncbi:MAG: hypothetical protein MUF22_00285 [Chitinispirillaceae bacterium]|nr:hypothetical protein [Chitinispirillaceae bacterium]